MTTVMKVDRGQLWKRNGVIYRVRGIVDGHVNFKAMRGSMQMLHWRAFEETHVQVYGVQPVKRHKPLAHTADPQTKAALARLDSLMDAEAKRLVGVLEVA